MREILFRGKRLDNGEWVEGFYCLPTTYVSRDIQKPVIIVKSDLCNNCLWSDAELPVIVFAVDPDTIGQYTGLTDKNGVKIFEGDILEKDWMCEDGQLYIVSFGYHLPLGCGVDTARNATGWYLDRIKDPEYGGCTRTDGMTGICTQIKYVDLFDWNIGITTIRGNKWDNPELVSENGI